MKAMVLEKSGAPLQLMELPIPHPRSDQVLVKVTACGVCRTDLHIVDGDLKHPDLPIVPGHEIIGHVVEAGRDVRRLKVGDKVGIPWLGSTCGSCRYCQSGEENLCDTARFTGYQIDGGYAEYTVADARYAFPVQGESDAETAPLLCAGLIGYRSLRMAGDAERLGIYGFGAAAHIVAQVAKHQGREVYAFTREGDDEAQAFARALGAKWACSSTEPSPEELDATIIFAPVGSLVPAAFKAVRKGGVVVTGGIHMSDIPSFPYELLWGERILRSVANLTRKDAEAFLDLAPRIPIKAHVEPFPLNRANEALARLRDGRLQGAAVLLPQQP